MSTRKPVRISDHATDGALATPLDASLSNVVRFNSGVIGFEGAVGSQVGPVFDQNPLPEPWSRNGATTVFMSNWWRDTFKDPEKSVTTDAAEAKRTCKVLIPPAGPFRIVLDFEDFHDGWADWAFIEMERFRAGIKAKFPHVTISAYLSQGLGISREQVPLAAKHAKKLQDFVAPFDEVTPSLYVNEGDDSLVDWSSEKNIRASLFGTPQFRTMRLWEKNLAPGKRLAPCVWWGVPHKPGRILTRDQFWRVQVGAAISSRATSDAILWGNIANASELATFNAHARQVIAG